jgi:hypothetical protein
MKSSRVSLSGASAARAAYSSAFCQQYPICSRIPLPTTRARSGLISGIFQLGERDLGSIAVHLLCAGGGYRNPPHLGERYRFGGDCFECLTDARRLRRDTKSRHHRGIETETVSARSFGRGDEVR